MEKRAILFGLLLILSIFAVYSNNLNLVSAQSIGDLESIPEKLEQVPQSPEDIKDEIRSRYLQQEWGKIIEKIPFIGAIHKFLVNNPLLFQILFAQPYTLSLSFILAIILWGIIAFYSGDIIKSSELVKSRYSFLIGSGLSIILAQTGLIKGITILVLDLIFARDAWWMRAILWLILAVFVAISYTLHQVLGNALRKKIKEAKKAKEIAEIKGEVKETKEYVEGVEEGEKLTKGIKKGLLAR